MADNSQAGTPGASRRRRKRALNKPFRPIQSVLLMTAKGPVELAADEIQTANVGC
jgi:hypothetical protein